MHCSQLGYDKTVKSRGEQIDGAPYRVGRSSEICRLGAASLRHSQDNTGTGASSQCSWKINRNGYAASIEGNL